MKTLSAVRAIVRQVLRDEFVSGTAYDWQDDEIDLHIGECLVEISERSPYEKKETLTTTASSKELDISSIADLLELDPKHSIEFRTGQDPPDYRNCEVFGNILRMDIDFLPSANENVYLYCHKVHQLTESSSTLSPQLESLLVLGVCAKVAISKARSHIGKVNVGGARTHADIHGWGTTNLALYRADLKRLAKPKIARRYPKD